MEKTHITAFRRTYECLGWRPQLVHARLTSCFRPTDSSMDCEFPVILSQTILKWESKGFVSNGSSKLSLGHKQLSVWVQKYLQILELYWYIHSSKIDCFWLWYFWTENLPKIKHQKWLWFGLRPGLCARFLRTASFKGSRILPARGYPSLVWPQIGDISIHL